MVVHLQVFERRHCLEEEAVVELLEKVFQKSGLDFQTEEALVEIRLVVELKQLLIVVHQEHLLEVLVQLEM